MWPVWWLVPVLLAAFCAADTDPQAPGLYQIEGRLMKMERDPDPEWFRVAFITVTGGAETHYGFPTADGSFVVSNLAPGSYVVDVTNPRYQFEPVRVDINSKGKLRARRVNHIVPSEVTQLPYPLKLRPLGPYQFFLKREQWRITDILFSPMVMMMILPVVLILVLPKMMNDPETRKEMEQISMPKYDMPELSEMMTSFFGSGDKKKGAKPKKKQT
ncbi:ER membrane protein complex subunit 7-like [Amphibalanus amphitrite]|uniref:ER membrane protein complex subunit 7-like n=1 Tax=Amphibalanus amphitrite TaxID=1232801 RepID=UPI001C92B2A4|nr:ER membrane protein complex subunit 7-like [Amphibalanus amphitrite]XP_043243022.1 ER membrane protein complex subunit 7-like [Amphibalanus amphitrite]XP_043243023.1 ER membrane protein complex subunit 7-like [Amphibalanus amphitrite]